MNVEELFLSHSSEDADAAERLATTLRDHGVPVWISTRNIIGAQQWQDEIGAALRRCDWFAVLLTPNSIKSMWVKRELMFALQQHRFDTKIVPVILHECDYDGFHWALSSFEVINFSSSLERGLTQLLRIWGLGFDKSKSAFPLREEP